MFMQLPREMLRYELLDRLPSADLSALSKTCHTLRWYCDDALMERTQERVYVVYTMLTRMLMRFCPGKRHSLCTSTISEDVCTTHMTAQPLRSPSPAAIIPGQLPFTVFSSPQPRLAEGYRWTPPCLVQYKEYGDWECGRCGGAMHQDITPNERLQGLQTLQTTQGRISLVPIPVGLELGDSLLSRCPAPGPTQLAVVVTFDIREKRLVSLLGYCRTVTAVLSVVDVPRLRFCTLPVELHTNVPSTSELPLPSAHEELHQNMVARYVANRPDREVSWQSLATVSERTTRQELLGEWDCIINGPRPVVRTE